MNGPDASDGGYAPGTRAVHGGLPAAADGEPILPGPVFGSLFHLAGDIDEANAAQSYHRLGNPTWTRYEEALAGLEGGDVVLFSSGMAAVAAVLTTLLSTGDVLVAPADGYHGLRGLTDGLLARMGVQVRLVPSTDEAVLEAVAAEPAPTLVWVESPTNPGLGELDVARIARAAHARGTVLAVDSTLATPLRRRPLQEGADLVVVSASKHLTGHSDLVLGYVAVADPGRAAALVTTRLLGGAIAGPMETWLAHRSLPTLEVRLLRQEETAQALVAALQERTEVSDVRYPGFGSVLAFTLADADRASAFLAACALVAEATSFGGVHSTAERRGRWPADAVAPGFIRFSVGIETTTDLVADVLAALDRTG